ncbi:hypothetical protein GYH30_049811 [Glycine max]|nr:hypothetical protein GYH30_049811 [Glycine max]
MGKTTTTVNIGLSLVMIEVLNGDFRLIHEKRWSNFEQNASQHLVCRCSLHILRFQLTHLGSGEERLQSGTRGGRVCEVCGWDFECGGLGFEDSRKAHTDELKEGCLQDFGYGWSRGSGCDAG